MTKLKLNYILFDVIGTTVSDSSNGGSLILDCFSDAFLLNGFQIPSQTIIQQRGKSKREAIGEILIQTNNNTESAGTIYSNFIRLLTKSVTGFKEMHDAANLFHYLRHHHIRIGLGSGLPKEFMIAIIHQVGWDIKWFDYIGSSEELGKGRPDPIMILESMSRLAIHDVTTVLKIGDTLVDIQEGKNAGVKTAVVLTGTQEKTELLNGNPDYIFSSISELKKILAH